MPHSILAQNTTDVPQVNLNQTPTGNSPFGGFQLTQCDGPDLSGIKASTPIKIQFRGQTYSVPPVPPGYRPCNFKGAMVQAQFLINVMLVVGVVAALIGFAYAGYLYITGTPGNLKKAHSVFPKVLIGFVLMLTAWFIVYQILAWLTPSGSLYLPQ